ncbi:MAG: DUF3127 domain-containing protein [Prevotellaceae bacterium]|nr:DUF3127 domain-containing protein [Prevotellaceae bacterium]
MEISGRIITVLPLATGEGRNGTWRSQDYVLETADQYPRKVCFNLFNDRISQYPMAVGDDVTVSFDIESREYNGRWYTSIRAWKVEKKTESAELAPPFDAPPPSIPPFEPENPASGGSDLPF